MVVIKGHSGMYNASAKGPHRKFLGKYSKKFRMTNKTLKTI